MSDTIIAAFIGFFGRFFPAMIPTAVRKLRKGGLRDIRGTWIYRQEEGGTAREHIVEIENQYGREIEGYRILKGANRPVRKYLLKGFFHRRPSVGVLGA